MHIAIILTRQSPTFVAAADILRRRGARVDLLFANATAPAVDSIDPECELCVIKSGRPSALALGGAFHNAGVPTLPRYPLAMEHRDKITVARRLAAGGVALPETFVTNITADLEELLAAGPLMFKPPLGSRGEGIRVVRDVKELRALETADLPIMAQRYLEPDPGGSYLTAYRMGEELFGLRRRWPIEEAEDEVGVPWNIPAAARDTVQLCGDIYGVDLYGVDFVISGGEHYVVDMGLHASFLGVPDGPGRVASYLRRACKRVQR